jgi:hypothetical protein
MPGSTLADHHVKLGGDVAAREGRSWLASALARGRKEGAPFKMTAAKVRLAMAAMGQKNRMWPICAANWVLRGRRSIGTSRRMARDARTVQGS